jgi:hypothetical protein
LGYIQKLNSLSLGQDIAIPRMYCHLFWWIKMVCWDYAWVRGGSDDDKYGHQNLHYHWHYQWSPFIIELLAQLFHRKGSEQGGWQIYQYQSQYQRTYAVSIIIKRYILSRKYKLTRRTGDLLSRTYRFGSLLPVCLLQSSSFFRYCATFWSCHNAAANAWETLFLTASCANRLWKWQSLWSHYSHRPVYC